MICYFGWIILDLRIILYVIFIDSYIISKIIPVFVSLIWFCHNVFKFVLINYMCETVTTKASNTSDLLNRLSYSTYDVEIREIVSFKINLLKYIKINII
ncbi:hypothetical protein ALC57_01839 [Trachymyrmex cornetzi]|uniref:Gustatory receptor n=1 Tax=Trachymyrmex cornetzi TaxID=471704 RepID=A0A195EKS8_9HYME|nr:hypothetical protein ALC57_01839 [Trachymyrmex cornetzi]